MTAAYKHSSLNMLTPGALFHQYKLLERIGIGGQGVVWSALDQDQNRIYAIKFNEVPDTDEAEADDIRDEQQLEELVKLRHPHILPFREYGFDEQMRFTVSPYVPGGTLTEKIKTTPLSSDQILQYGMEIASALDYLHSQGVIHRDLKSANILLDLSQNIYLADFGLARLVTTSTLAFHTGHGTPPYASPEQIQLKAITPRSDIYSFGILLYEMFTGQLPWNGKKQLGMEQTHSKQKIPDPREFNDELPDHLAKALRRITSANPQLRPRTAGETMEMLHSVFETTTKPQPEETLHDNLITPDKEIEELLKHGMERWESTNGTYNLGLTKFALIDLERVKIDLKVYSHFMLSQALTYGYNDDQWWFLVNNPSERLAISSALLQKKNEAVTARIIAHLIEDMDILALPEKVPEDVVRSLLDIGTNSDNVFLRQQILNGIHTLAPPGMGWNDSFDTGQMKNLGVQALEDSEAGDTAAELIGHLRSNSAVRVVLNHPNEERKYSTLLLIQREAGNLPPFVQGGVRFRLSMEWIMNQLIQQPISLISAYVMAFFGSALGVGTQVYLTYNLTNFFDNVRITVSLERGLIIGLVFGLGIFITRVIMERFPASGMLLRISLATIMGGVVINISLFIFHVLFLNTPPMGFLMTAGCALISFTYSVSSLLGSRIAKMILSSLSVFLAITGTWLIHTNSATSLVELTPMFKYDYTWPLAKVSFTALSAALFMGILGNLINLSIMDE